MRQLFDARPEQPQKEEWMNPTWIGAEALKEQYDRKAGELMDLVLQVEPTGSAEEHREIDAFLARRIKIDDLTFPAAVSAGLLNMAFTEYALTIDTQTEPARFEAFAQRFGFLLKNVPVGGDA